MTSHDARRLGAARGVDLPDLDVRRPTLEDVYLALTTDDRKDARK